MIKPHRGRLTRGAERGTGLGMGSGGLRPLCPETRKILLLAIKGCKPPAQIGGKTTQIVGGHAVLAGQGPDREKTFLRQF